MRTKTLLLLLSLLLPMAASAYDVCINGIYYNIVKKAKQATVTYGENESGTYSGDVVIPSTVVYDGTTCSVVGIGGNAFYACKMTSLTIPHSITKIVGGAFQFSSIGSLYISDIASYCSIEFEGFGDLTNPIQFATTLYINNNVTTDLIIPDEVTAISDYAFNNAKQLTSVKLPNGLIEIGVGAFEDCTNISNVNLPSTLTEIGTGAFSGCTKLTSNITIPNGMSEIKPEIFRGCTKLTSLKIGNGVTYIYKGAFRGCGIQSLVIGNSVETIAENAFYGCNNLTSVTFPNSVKTIDAGAFQGCTNLSSVTVGTGVKSMGSGAFQGCTNLTNVYISDLAKWCQISFSSYSMQGSLGEGTYSTVSNPLCYAKHLYLNGQEIKDLIIPSTIKKISSNAFNGFSGITSVTIPDEIETIGVFAFNNNENLKKVTCGNGILNKEQEGLYKSFNKCNNLTTVILGNKEFSISGCFANCPELTDVYLPTIVLPYCYTIYSTSGSYPANFTNSYIEYATLHVPEIAINSYKETEPWSNFGTIVALKEGDPGYVNSNDPSPTIMFTDSQVANICYQQWDTNGDGKFTEEEAALVTDLGSVFKGNKQIVSFNELHYFTGLTTISDDAFNGCTSLKSVMIPSEVTSINNNAFYGCSSLTSIFIPSSVTCINNTAFSCCRGLTSIIVDNDNTVFDSRDSCNAIIHKKTNELVAGCSNTVIPNSVTAIGYMAFCNKNLVDIVIPNSVKSIDSYAFYGCAFKEIVIPNSVSSIGARAFSNCTALTSCIIPNSVTSIGYSLFEECRALQSVVISSSVNEIDMYSFYNCSQLKDVYCNYTKGVVSTGTQSFGGVKLANVTLHVHANLIENYLTANTWKNFGNIVALKVGDPGYEAPADNVTLTANSYSRVYGEANPTFGYTVSEGTVTSGEPTITCSATATSPVGTYDIVIAKGSVSNSTVELVKGTLTITKAPLTISAGNYNKVEGEDNPTFTPTFSGFKNGETKSVLTKQPTITTTATKTSPAGNYPVTLSGAEANNYTITYQNGILTVAAYSTPNDDNIVFVDAKAKTLCVQNWDTNNDGELSKDEAAAVTDIGMTFRNSEITSFDEFHYFTGVTDVSAYAFMGCNSLVSIKLPNSVKQIGMWAFKSCSNLTSVRIGKNVTKYYGGCFTNCNALTTVYSCNPEPVVIGNNNFPQDTYTNGTLYVPTGKKAKYEATDGWKEFTNIVESDDLVIPLEVGEMFTADNISYCVTNTNPLEVQIGKSNPRYYAINDKEIAGSITSIVIPATVVGSDNKTYAVTNIVKGAFTNCTALQEIHSKIQTPTSSDGNPFSSSTCQTATLYVPVGSASFYKVAVEWKAFKNIVPEGENVENSLAVGERFTANGINYQVTYPLEVSVGARGYRAIDKSTEGALDIPPTVIGPDGNRYAVNAIGYQAFENCSGLTSITLPSSIASIDVFAFEGCSGLTSITIPKNVLSIEYNILFRCSNMNSIVVESGNRFYDSRDNCNAIIKTKENRLISACQSTVVPNTVTSFGSYSFGGISTLTSFTFREGVTSVADNMFRDCINLASVHLPSTLEYINFQAFRGCSSLASIFIPKSVTSINAEAFIYCDPLNSIVVEEGNTVYDSREKCNAIIKTESNELVLGSNHTVIPNTVTAIGRYAFFGRRTLTSITIPCQVTSIGKSAFYYCRALAKVSSMTREPFAVTDVFVGIPDDATLYVPAGTKALYEATDGWKDFANIVEMKDLEPVADEGEVVDFEENSDITEDTDLTGTVVNNMYYNIGIDAGGYNADDKCIVITKETSDEQMEALEGLGITDEELKKNFTGIIFKVPAGSGKVAVTAETSGNMTLKVKVGNGLPMEMELSGRLKINVPYNVTEDTYIYIFAGTQSAARGLKRTSGDQSLKIYGVELETTLVKGDANGDKKVNDADVTEVANRLVGKTSANFVTEGADINSDGVVNIVDQVLIIKRSLRKR